jgi:hypothetical protein
MAFRATFDEDPWSTKVQWKFSILLVESDKLDAMAFRATLDEDPWSTRVQWKISNLLVGSHKMDHMAFRATLNEDPWSRVQWNFLNLIGQEP